MGVWFFSGIRFTVGFDSFFQWAISVSGLRCCTVGVLVSVDVSAAGVFRVSVDVFTVGVPILTGLFYISPLEFYLPWVNRSLWLIGSVVLSGCHYGLVFRACMACCIVRVYLSRALPFPREDCTVMFKGA
jgi:hypothetical protein